jgi:hypothetical protein
MSIPIHDVRITTGQLQAVANGGLVEVMTDKDMVVLLVTAESYEQTPGRNGAELIPVNGFMAQELLCGGHTSWVPHRSPYVFSIAIEN